MELDVYKLIAEVKKRPCIYDSTCPEYSDRPLRKRLWDEIYTALCPDWDNLEYTEKALYSKEIQKRWQSCRDCFRRELKTQRNTPVGASSKRRQYIYFDKMSFMLPVCQKDGARRSSVKEETTQEETETIEFVSPASPSSYTEQDDEPIMFEIPAERNDPINPTDLLKTLIDTKRREMDEDEAFLMSLLPAFKKYNLRNKFLLRIELMNTILKFDRSQKRLLFKSKGKMSTVKTTSD